MKENSTITASCHSYLQTDGETITMNEKSPISLQLHCTNDTCYACDYANDTCNSIHERKKALPESVCSALSGRGPGGDLAALAATET